MLVIKWILNFIFDYKFFYDELFFDDLKGRVLEIIIYDFDFVFSDEFFGGVWLGLGISFNEWDDLNEDES